MKVNLKKKRTITSIIAIATFGDKKREREGEIDALKELRNRHCRDVFHIFARS